MIKYETIYTEKQITPTYTRRFYAGTIKRIYCDNCGEEIKADNARIKYCDTCRQMIARQNSAERSARYRQRKKNKQQGIK